MKVAVVGAGVAGAYLARRLDREGHEVRVIERQPKERFRARCAWGTEEYLIAPLLARAGVRFADYVLFRARAIRMDYRWLTVYGQARGLCTFDKTRLLLDLLDGLPVEFGAALGTGTRERLDEESDLVVDATGPVRALLPPVERDFRVPAVQVLYRTRSLEWEDFYVRLYRGLFGYLWVFPLGEGEFHIGSIATEPGHRRALDEFLRRHPGEVLERMGGSVRAIPPSRCLPFVEGRTVGVGESVGTVVPLLGEGILQSARCADLFLESLRGGAFDGAAYTRRVLRKFRTWGLHAHLTDAVREERALGKALWGIPVAVAEAWRASPRSWMWIPRSVRESIGNLAAAGDGGARAEA